jgi:hypothetical protein
VWRSLRQELQTIVPFDWCSARCLWHP